MPSSFEVSLVFGVDNPLFVLSHLLGKKKRVVNFPLVLLLKLKRPVERKFSFDVVTP